MVEDANTFITRMAEIVKNIQEDKQTRLKKIKVLAKQVDEEDMEYFYEDLEKTDKGIHHIMEITGFLFRNMGEAVSPQVATTLLPLFAPILLDISDKRDYELIDAVCFICDCMEHGGAALYGQISSQGGAKFLEIINF